MHQLHHLMFEDLARARIHDRVREAERHARARRLARRRRASGRLERVRLRARKVLLTAVLW